MVVLAALVGLALAASPAAAETRSAVDRSQGLHFRLDGDVLLVSLAPQPNREPPDARGELWGKRIRGGCSSRYLSRNPRRHAVHAARLWPHGAHQVAFFFDRDISRSAKWCLVEDAEGGADVAFAELQSPPGRLLVQTEIDPSASPPPEGSRTFMRLRDSRGRLVVDRQATELDRYLRPGRYRFTSYQRHCVDSCETLGRPTLECSRTLRIRFGPPVALLVTVDFTEGCLIELVRTRARGSPPG
jgi:hypothetical protein